MIKLIASDMDGTLLDGNQCVPEGTYDLILRLRDAGIRFVASSGRRFDTLSELFEPVADCMDFVASNGAQVIIEGELVDREVFSHAALRRLARTCDLFDTLHLALFDETRSYLLDDEARFEREVDKNLSGGEVKRIEIATILARDPKLAIYDEPEAGIDLWSFDRLTETFRDIHEARDGRSIVIISHQERIIQLADEIVLLKDGKVMETGTPDELMPKLGFVAKGIPGCQLSTPTELHITEIPTTC
mgnify:CR=1 FL=1